MKGATIRGAATNRGNMVFAMIFCRYDSRSSVYGIMFHGTEAVFRCHCLS